MTPRTPSVWGLLPFTQVVKSGHAARLQNSPPTSWQPELRRINETQQANAKHDTVSVRLRLDQCSAVHGAELFLSAPPLQTHGAAAASSCISVSSTLTHNLRKSPLRWNKNKNNFDWLQKKKRTSPIHLEIFSLFWFTKFSRDMLYFQWKLITRKGEPLLAYLPSIAMMFCFGFHQSGRWRRGSDPLQGWRTGGDSCGGTVHKRAGRKQTVWDKRCTNI